MTVAKTTIHERMVAILGDLPAIGKSQENKQQGFMFRGQDDVLNALNPLLAKHGVILIPDVVERIVGQRVTKSGTVMFEVNLHVRFTAYGAGGDFVVGSAWGEGTDMGDKATSKAMTMAFKYWLTQAFAISSQEAPDPDGDTPPETGDVDDAPATRPERPASAPATDEDVDAYLTAVGTAGFDKGVARAALVKDSAGEPVLQVVLVRHRKQFDEALARIGDAAVGS